MIKLVLLRSTSAVFEPVLHKRARVAEAAGMAATVVYWDRAGQDVATDIENIPYLPVSVGATRYGAGIFGAGKRAAFSLKALKTLRALAPDVVHAFDLDMMLVATAYQRLFNKNVRIVYDILDFIYGFSSPIPRFIRARIRQLDAQLMARADIILLPDENRSRQIPLEYQGKVRYVYNAPELPADFDPKATAAAGDREPVASKPIQVLYVGGLSADRGLVPLMETCARHPDRFHLTVGGQGWLKPAVEKYARENANIEYLGQVRFSTVLELTRTADLLYAVYDPDCAVNKVASPNKFFEAVAFGKPIVVARGTSVDDKVAKLDMGYLVDYSLNSIERTLLSTTREDLIRKGRNAEKVQSVYSWEAAQTTLRQVYTELSRA